MCHFFLKTSTVTVVSEAISNPVADNSIAEAWAASDETGKSSWAPFSFTIPGSDGRYTHDSVSVFDVLLLHQGEVLLDDLRLTINGSNRLTNAGFENGTSSWRQKKLF